MVDYVVTVTAKCKKDVVGSWPATLEKVDPNDACKWKGEFETGLICSTPIPINEAIAKLVPFVGPLLIVFGLVMWYWGSKFIFTLVGVVIGLAITAVLFGITFSVFFTVETTMGPLIGAFVGCLAVGALIAVLTYKFTKNYAVQIVAALAAAQGCMYLT